MKVEASIDSMLDVASSEGSAEKVKLCQASVGDESPEQGSVGQGSSAQGSAGQSSVVSVNVGNLFHGNRKTSNGEPNATSGKVNSTSGKGNNTTGKGASGAKNPGKGKGTVRKGSSDKGISGQGSSGQGSSGSGSCGRGPPGPGGDPSDNDESFDPDGEDEEDEDEEEEDNEEVPTSNPSSPSVSAEGNWKSLSALMSETFPVKSKAVYLAAYKDFESYLKSKNMWVADVCPSELGMLSYFHHLKTSKRFVSTSIWSQYSRINAVLKRRFGVGMKQYPRIQDLLKSFEAGHRVKKSSIFTPQQALINLYLSWMSNL